MDNDCRLLTVDVLVRGRLARVGRKGNKSSVGHISKKDGTLAGRVMKRNSGFKMDMRAGTAETGAEDRMMCGKASS